MVRHLTEADDRDELFARRDYLLYRLCERTAGPDSMPAAIPEQFRGEWALGTHSMTAGALFGLSRREPGTRSENLRGLECLIEKALRPEMRAFDRQRWRVDPLDDLRPANGQEPANGHGGYLGHLNLMLAFYRELGGRRADFEHLYHRISAHLVAALQSRPYMFVETYPEEIYVPDNAVIVAGLAYYDRHFPRRAIGASEIWLEQARRTMLDSDTGLLVFNVSRGGKPGLVARGSGTAWSIYYLAFADAAFAGEQFRLLRRFHAVRPLGFGGMLEWPGRYFDSGDLDSGPLFFGVSPSATGFAPAGARLVGDDEFYGSLLRSAELFGFSYRDANGLRYLSAPLVGDAILLAMRTLPPRAAAPAGPR